MGVDFSNPQTWNRYAYVGNNPLSVTDPNGLWWTYEHNNIIDNAFPGLSREQRQILKDTSKQVDKESAMTQSEQYKHGMTSEDNDPFSSTGAWNPQYEYDDYVEQNEHDAKEIQAEWIASGHSGIAPGALAAFGNALHAITDSKSPSHEGFQKVNWLTLPWHAREGIPFAYMGRKRAAAAAARSAFYDVFGADMGQQATHESVTVRIIPESVKPVDPNQINQP